MPTGETGEVVAAVGVAPGTGDGGKVFVGLVVLGTEVVLNGFDCCFGFEEEKMAAVTAEPVNAEAAATRARVFLDMVNGLHRMRLSMGRTFHEIAMITRNEKRLTREGKENHALLSEQGRSMATSSI